MTYGPLSLTAAVDFTQHVTTPGTPRAGFARLGIGNDLVLRWVAPNGTVYEAASKNQLDAHVAEIDPAVHTASKIQTTLSNVQTDLDTLQADKAENTAVDAAFKAVSSSPTTVNINTSASEQNLLSFSLAPGSLGRDGDMLVVEAFGDILANSGSPSWTWKAKAGSAVMDTPATPVTVSANLRRWKLLFAIFRTTVATKVMSASMFISQPTATTDFNPIDPAHSFVGNMTDIADTDFNAAMTIAFTVQMSVNNLNNRTRMYGYNARKVRGNA